MKRRLLALDLDGTLLGPNGEPHPADLRAVLAAREAGVRVTIVTGRLYSGTKATAIRLGLDGAVGCVDGSHVVSASTHTTLMHHGVFDDDARTLRDSIAAGGPATFLFARDRVIHDDAGVPFLEYVTLWSGALNSTRNIFEHEAWSDPDGITSVVAIGTADQIALAAKTVEERLPGKVSLAAFPVHRLGERWGLVARGSAGDKGTALRWIAEHEKIEIEDTVCVGDWLNDVPMFRVAGKRYAMSQAPHELKVLATEVLEADGIRGGGVAEVIYREFGVRA